MKKIQGEGGLFSNYTFVSDPRVSFLDNSSLLSNKKIPQKLIPLRYVSRNIRYYPMYEALLSLNYRFIMS